MSWKWSGSEQSPDPASTSERAAEAPQSPGPPSCWGRFIGEINPFQPWFQVQDHVLKRQLNIPDSFAPTGWDVVLWKLLTTALTLFTLVYGFLDKTASFYLAYLTNWGVVLSCLYLCLSCVNTILLADRTAQPPDRVGPRIALTWLLFESSAHIEVTIIVLFWSMDFHPGSTQISYLTIAAHSVIGAVVWTDGLVVNRIPVRFQHWLGFVMPMEGLWVAWSVAQAFLDVGNPDRNDNDPTTNDDAIYPFFVWKDKWLFCLSVSLIALFGLGFVSYLVLWTMSIYRLPLGCCCRRQDYRYYTDATFYEQEEDKRGISTPKIRDVEEGSIFARWMR